MRTATAATFKTAHIHANEHEEKKKDVRKANPFLPELFQIH